MDGAEKKEIASGLAHVGAAAVTGGGIAAAMAFLAGLVSLTMTTMMGRDTRRADDLYRRMAEADEDPEDFVAFLAEKVRDGDEEMLIKLRALIRADLESASPDALEPIARLGHAYVRGKCSAWVARGWVRLLSEVSSAELDSLAEQARRFRAALQSGDEIQERLQFPPARDVVVMLFGPTSAAPETAWALDIHPQLHVFGLGGQIEMVYTASARRLLDLFVQQGLASSRGGLLDDLRSRPVGGDRPAVQFAREAAVALTIAFGV